MSDSRPSRSSLAPAAPLIVPAPLRADAPPDAGPALHVLVLDADAAAGARLARWLHRQGCAVALACSIDEAETILAAARFDLLITDPDLLGRVASRWLEQLCARAARPAVILTPSQLTLQRAARAARLPLAGYLPKPVDHAALRALLDRQPKPFGR